MLGQIITLLSENLLILALHLESGCFPKPLSASREAECFVMARQGDAKARDTLISHNLRLVAHIAKKYYQAQCDSDDLISIGTLGLIKAVDSFKDGRGTRFSTYAARCIENEMLMELRSLKKTHGTVNLQDPIESDSDGNALYIGDMLADDRDFYGDIEREQLLLKLREELTKSIHGRERLIISLRYGLFGNRPHTQQQVSQLMHISRSYVSRIEKKILGELRERLDT